MAKRRISKAGRARIAAAQRERWAKFKSDAAAKGVQYAFNQSGGESVDHPLHYGGDVPHEVWKCLNAWNLETDALLWNAVKYIARAGKKGEALEDLKKACWYLQKRIDLLEAK